MNFFIPYDEMIYHDHLKLTRIRKLSIKFTTPISYIPELTNSRCPQILNENRSFFHAQILRIGGKPKVDPI